MTTIAVLIPRDDPAAGVCWDDTQETLDFLRPIFELAGYDVARLHRGTLHIGVPGGHAVSVKPGEWVALRHGELMGPWDRDTLDRLYRLDAHVAVGCGPECNCSCGEE